MAQAPEWYFYPALSSIFPNYPVNNRMCRAHNGTRVMFSYHYCTDEGRLRVLLGQPGMAFLAGMPLFYVRIRGKKKSNSTLCRKTLAVAALCSR